MHKDTVSIHFVRSAVARLSNAQRARVLAQAGIAEALVRSSQGRVPARAFSELWLAISREIDDEFFGLDHRSMKVGSFALLCHALLGQKDLRQALNRTLRGFHLFLDDIQAELSIEGREAVIRVENRIREPEARRFADETFLVMVHGLACWLVGRRLPLLCAEFAYSEPPHANEYTVMYSENLRFDAQQTLLRFKASVLDLPVVQTPKSLKELLRTAPQSVFLKYKNEAGVTWRLRARLRKCIGEPIWPVLDDLARELHISVTTLRRRLDAEFTSYQCIKNEVRHEAASRLLRSSDMTISDIGALVGFQEAGAFRRAFKAWSGVLPGEYRRQSCASMVNRSSIGHRT